MATYRKRGNAWRADIFRKGIRMTSSFDTKAQAIMWATQKEAEIMAGVIKLGSDKTLAETFYRYAELVSPTKRGKRWEVLRINHFCRTNPALSAMRLQEVSAPHFAAWRDTRLRKVGNATVLREMNLFSNVFSIARDEWKWISESPMKGVRRPKEPKPRDRRIVDDEQNRLLHVLGYSEEHPPRTISTRVGFAFLFAIETAMRGGEILALTWDRIHMTERYARLDVTKNGFGRNVPLSPRALRLLERLAPITNDSPESRVFGLRSSQMDAHFRKAKSTAGIIELHFHDTRHEAITRLAAKVDVLDLARIVGIRDLKILMVYYNKHAKDIALSLN